MYQLYILVVCPVVCTQFYVLVVGTSCLTSYVLVVCTSCRY